ncbi:hypothetical protein [Streptomyces sp. NPDC048282]|uniref:hypothetical protein n=1 Tax=unclassified Streptomyces TaxID=2593676 RepID=UPI0037135D81
MRWLIPEDFTHPLYAGLRQCLTALARRNEPVDPVTVLWEAQQRALRRASWPPPTASGQIEAYAGDPAHSPFQLVVGARRSLAGIDDHIPHPLPAPALRAPRPHTPHGQPDSTPRTPVAGPHGPITGTGDNTAT